MAECAVMTVYKICGAAEWREAVARGSYAGSEDDARDGYIHLSTAEQLAGTAAKYFRGHADLVIVAFSTASFGETLRWEAARGGALFPHVYAALKPQDALWVRPLPLRLDGVPQVPKDL